MSRIVFYESVPRTRYIVSRFAMPRVGALILGTILKRAGYDVSVYVEDIRPPQMEELLEADLVGISTLTAGAPLAYELAQTLRAKGVAAVLGGPHVTFLPDEALQYADYVFRGEAENSIVQLAKAIETGEGLDLVPGLSFRQDGKVTHNGPAIPPHDLDALPTPDFSLLEGGLRGFAPVASSRGCPHDCTFCSVTKMFGRKYRFRSAERVLNDLASLDLSHCRILFTDDDFAANRPRLYELLEEILRRNLRFSWSCQVRAELAKDEHLLDLMRRSGCRTLYVGFDSANPDTLEAYRKSQTLAEIENSIEAMRKHGLRVYGMFVLGADTDTIETVRSTLRFALENRIDTMQFTILTPLPGTDCFKQFEQQGRLLHKDWHLYDLHHVVFEPAQMDANELQMEVVRALRKFYSIPRIIGDILRFRFFEAQAKAFNRWFHVQAARSAMVSRVCQAASKANP